MPFHKMLENKNMHRSMPMALIIWVVFFCYAICAALVFQKVLLPLIPSLHAGGGLITGDSIFFDSVAVKLAEQIRLYGWGSWQLYPANGEAGNVAILGALYAVFGHDPTLIIPVNAAIHALGGVLIFLLARELSGKESIGTYAGIIASGLFIIFPSALNWYGQLHKDGYAIAGTLLILLTWVKAFRGSPDMRGWLMLLLAHLAGVVLVGMVRPYNLKLLLVVTIFMWLMVVGWAVLRRQLRQELMPILFLLVAVITLLGGMRAIFPKELSTVSINGTSVVQESVVQDGNTYKNWQGNDHWKWEESSWLPNSIEGYIELAAKTRAAFIDYGIRENAKSMIDQDVAPQNIEQVVFFLPRALQISIFAPFPTNWLSNISMTRLVSVAETFISYLCLPGVLLLLIYNRKPAVLAAIYFTVFFLLSYGFTTANLGTLYRLRYPYQFVMITLGVLGWLTWLDRTGRMQRLLAWMKSTTHSKSPNEATTGDKPPRKEVLGSGLFVMLLTLLCFVGFFIRDIMMAHSFGLGGELDNFFIALMIPMFIVTVLCMPLGAAFIPAYLEIKESVSLQAAKSLLENTAAWVTAALLLICLLLYLIGPTLLPLLYFKGATPDMGQLDWLMDIALPILLFSGMVILGNAALSANGRVVLTSVAQLVVPVVAILALALFGASYGVKAVMYGMVVGQLLNLFVVQYYLRRQDESLWSKLGSFPFKRSNQPGSGLLLVQYLPLVASAFFMSIAAPVSTMLAMSLPGGAVSAFNLGNKVVLFVTGLVGTAVGTVMLPYFSTLVSKNRLVSARHELSFFLLFATFISVPISALIYIWSEPIVRLIFEGGVFGNDATAEVTRVMQYSVVQLPFFICNSLLLKFATATKHVFAISAVAIVGLLVNVAASLILMKHMGVAGIALGMTISMVVSTVLLVLVLVRHFHITGLDAVVMLLNWLLYLTLLMCVHFESMPSIFVAMFAYVVLLLGYFNSLSYDVFSKIRVSS